MIFLDNIISKYPNKNEIDDIFKKCTNAMKIGYSNNCQSTKILDSKK